MTQASDKRWIVAQRAEKKYSHILEQIELPAESQFFSKAFPLNSEFGAPPPIVGVFILSIYRLWNTDYNAKSIKESLST